jgi:ribosome maturation protein SDO1
MVDLTLFSRSEYPLARCLDGSPAGYYFQEAKNKEDSTKFVIYLNGGGECDNEEACMSATTGPLGSSKYFNKQVNANGWYFGSDYCTNNNDFCGWNHIYDPYCSQDLHAGQRTTKNEWGLVFAGHHILEATLNDIEKQYNLKEATEILVTGASAGGIGVWTNVDWVAQRYPHAKVTGISVAGMYFYATYYEGPDHTNPGSMADFREGAWPNTFALYDAYVDEDCASAMSNSSSSSTSSSSPYPCMLLNNSLPYIDSDVFVVQAQTDQVVLEGHDQFPEDHMYDPDEQHFMHEWHVNMTVALEPFSAQHTVNANGVKRKLGAFAAACYTHCNFTYTQPIIESVNFYTAVHNFYFSEEEGLDSGSYVKIDDCGEMCNESCSFEPVS